MGEGSCLLEVYQRLMSMIGGRIRRTGATMKRTKLSSGSGRYVPIFSAYEEVGTDVDVAGCKILADGETI
jgi:hypothetical protein